MRCHGIATQLNFCNSDYVARRYTSVIKMGVLCIGIVLILMYIKEELACGTDKQPRVISNNNVIKQRVIAYGINVHIYIIATQLQTSR